MGAWNSTTCSSAGAWCTTSIRAPCRTTCSTESSNQLCMPRPRVQPGSRPDCARGSSPGRMVLGRTTEGSVSATPARDRAAHPRQAGVPRALLTAPTRQRRPQAVEGSGWPRSLLGCRRRHGLHGHAPQGGRRGRGRMVLRHWLRARPSCSRPLPYPRASGRLAPLGSATRLPATGWRGRASPFRGARWTTWSIGVVGT